MEIEELPTAVRELYKSIDEKDNKIADLESELDYVQKIAYLYNKKFIKLCNYLEKKGIEIPLKLKEVSNESD